MAVTATPATPAAPAAKAPAKRRTAKPAPAPANPVVTPEQAEELRITARLAELKTAYTTARAGEVSNKKALKAAKEQWENSRVINSRLLYSAAMLKPNADGAPNRTYAARNMHMTDEQLVLTGDALVNATKSAKGSIKNYIDAGIALQAAGLNPRGEEDKGNMEAPTDAERKVVAEAFRSGNKRKAGAPASTKDGGTGGGGEEGGEEGGAPAGSIPLTFADFNGHLGRLDATLKAIMTAKVELTAAEAEHALAALGTLAMTIAEYAGVDADGE